MPKTPIPRDYCIFSVPGEHSRKPHLGRLLAKYLPEAPNCLEVGLTADSLVSEAAVIATQT